MVGTNEVPAGLTASHLLQYFSIHFRLMPIDVILRSSDIVQEEKAVWLFLNVKNTHFYTNILALTRLQKCEHVKAHSVWTWKVLLHLFLVSACSFRVVVGPSLQLGG